MKSAECLFDERLISASVDSETTPEETRLVRDHVRGCHSCRAVFFAYASTRSTLLSAGVVPAVALSAPATLGIKIKRKIAASRQSVVSDIFERHFYKLSLAAGMLLYLSADNFTPEITMLFWLYFGFHLYVYSDKFDYRRHILDV